MSRYYDSKGSFRRGRAREEVDPMSSMGNMGDVMLVFACGLMVALVMAWQVDLPKFQQVDMEQELSQDQVSEIEGGMGAGNGYVDKGRVVQDPNTGQYYLVEDGAASSDSGSSEDSE